jgi:hypothetical protein
MTESARDDLLTDEQIDALFKLHGTVGHLDMGFARAIEAAVFARQRPEQKLIGWARLSDMLCGNERPSDEWLEMNEDRRQRPFPNDQFVPVWEIPPSAAALIERAEAAEARMNDAVARLVAAERALSGAKAQTLREAADEAEKTYGNDPIAGWLRRMASEHERSE